MNGSYASEDYDRIGKALQFLEEHFQERPSLRQIAASVHLSEYHFQRLFSRWVGVSPKQFLQYLTKEYAKRLLDESRNLLEVTYESGLSSPGRLHDLFVTSEAVTPGEYKSKGEGIEIAYGFHSTPFGECMLAVTERGISGLSFVVEGDRQHSLREMTSRWQNANSDENPERTQKMIDRVFNPAPVRDSVPLHLFLRGTNFQLKVWEALLKIPAGSAVAYEDIAAYLGKPGASRAVGSAVAFNPIAYIIPCHRVIRKMGSFGDYQGGSARKMAILGWEAAKMHEPSHSELEFLVVANS